MVQLREPRHNFRLLQAYTGHSGAFCLRKLHELWHLLPANLHGLGIEQYYYKVITVLMVNSGEARSCCVRDACLAPNVAVLTEHHVRIFPNHMSTFLLNCRSLSPVRVIVPVQIAHVLIIKDLLLLLLLELPLLLLGQLTHVLDVLWVYAPQFVSEVFNPANIRLIILGAHNPPEDVTLHSNMRQFGHVDCV